MIDTRLQVTSGWPSSHWSLASDIHTKRRLLSLWVSISCIQQPHPDLLHVLYDVFTCSDFA